MPLPFKHSFNTSNITSTLLNCFVLKTLCSKTKQMRSVLVKLLVLNQCLNGQGLSIKKVPESVQKIVQEWKFNQGIYNILYLCTLLLANEQILHPSKLTENAIALPNWLFSQFDSSIVAEAMLNIC